MIYFHYNRIRQKNIDSLRKVHDNGICRTKKLDVKSLDFLYTDWYNGCR